MYIAFLSTTDNAYIEVEYAYIDTFVDKNKWKEVRNSSILSLESNGLRSTADGNDTFGMSKELSNLESGKEYTLKYSFLTRNSTNSFGRISDDSQGRDNIKTIFHNVATDEKGEFTFTATKPTMYVAFLSTTDNAYIEIEYAYLTEEGDTKAPVLSSTDKTFKTTVGTPLNLEEVTAIDEVDGSVNVTKLGEEDFNTVGTFTIIYTATDTSNNSVSITHTYIVEHLDNTVLKLEEWKEPRNASTISMENGKLRSQADGTATFGMIKELSNLEVDKEYTLSYSFLTGTSTKSFGRVSTDAEGRDYSQSMFLNADKDKKGTFTFTATENTMYVAFLSITDGAYIEIEYAYLGDNESPSDELKRTLISGKLYTQEELARWRYNKDNKVYDYWSDLYYKSWAGYASIESSITTQAKLPDALANDTIVLRGTVGQKVDSYDNSTAFGMYDFGHFSYARDAVFVDLIEGTSTYTNTVKNLILEQAKEPTMQFSDRSYFPETNTYNIWLYAEWAHRVLKAYDYLPDNAFTTAERKIVDDWFKGAAEYFNIIANAEIDVMYTTRADDPKDSKVDKSKSFNNTPLKRYKNSGNFWAIGARLENKRFGMINLVTHVGVKYDIEKYKKAGAQWVKEYLAFHIDDDGYFAELNRGIAGKEWLSLGYVANTLVNMAEVAHILYHDGYSNLFDYKTKTRVNPNTGSIETGTVEKSLEWMMLKLRENFMLDSSKKIYILDSTADSSKELIHFCKNTSQNGQKVIGRTYPSATIINGYYHNDKIEEMYVNGNMCGFADRHLEINPGPVATLKID